MNTLLDILNSRLECEVIVVDDGSSDDTSKIVTELATNHNNLKIVSYHQNHGKGYAITFGIKRSIGEYILFMDADNSTTIDQIGPFIDEIKKGADIVVGSRRLPESKITTRQPLIREILGHIFRATVSLIMPLKVSDSQAGFKLISRNVALAYAERQRVFRWAFDVELLAMARARRWRVVELPIVWQNDSQSKVRLAGMINMLLEVIKVRYYYLTNYYI